MALDFGKVAFSVSFDPTFAFPVDARSYFESYDAAVAAAAGAMPDFSGMVILTVMADFCNCFFDIFHL